MGLMAEPAAGGDFITYAKFDARSGRFFTKAEGTDQELFEVKNMTAIWDLDQILTGWIEYPAGSAPIKTYDPSLTQAAPRPSADAKRGFTVNLFSEKNLLGLREFSSTAGVVISSINALYDAWLAAKDANPGKVPVVKCDECVAVKSAKSTNYAPQFEIVKWVDRPEEMPLKDAASPDKSAAKQEEPKAGAKHVDPPSKAAAGDDSDEF